MEYEQPRLDAELAHLDAYLRCGDTEMARLHLATFDLELSRYVVGEERVVFPALERLTPGPFPPTARMRSEHESLRRLVATLWGALDRGDPHGGLLVLGSLRSLLLLHVAKEDWILSPLLEEAV